KAYGLEEDCQTILEASGLTEDQITLPSMGTPISPLQVIVPTHKTNWPVKTSSSSIFEKALLGQMEGFEEEGTRPANGYGEEDLLEAEVQRNGHLEEAEEEEDADGWDMGDDVAAEEENDFANVEGTAAGAGTSEADMWARKSPLAADHV